ncbi:RING-type zinc-finger, LisH dimerization motif protein [Toxoplasma gondii MAS]|uniref:RING-type zinc-finger, LisH dimerization motif protein n=1 Tax=Toxoplasma gondii MAS TaxID=943118 RepID=A0A086QW93_TOXGO|nr:RING-type zinc-finger, LisH dimerization motif protein [Toxoplasma gondii MAS]
MRRRLRGISPKSPHEADLPHLELDESGILSWFCAPIRPWIDSDESTSMGSIPSAPPNLNYSKSCRNTSHPFLQVVPHSGDVSVSVSVDDGQLTFCEAAHVKDSNNTRALRKTDVSSISNVQRFRSPTENVISPQSGPRTATEGVLTNTNGTYMHAEKSPQSFSPADTNRVSCRLADLFWWNCGVTSLSGEESFHEVCCGTEEESERHKRSDEWKSTTLTKTSSASYVFVDSTNKPDQGVFLQIDRLSKQAIKCKPPSTFSLESVRASATPVRKECSDPIDEESNIFPLCASCSGATKVKLEILRAPSIGQVLKWYLKASSRIANGRVRLCRCTGVKHGHGQVDLLNYPTLGDWQMSLLRELSDWQDVSLASEGTEYFANTHAEYGEADADVISLPMGASSANSKQKPECSVFAREPPVRLPACGHVVSEEAFHSCVKEAMKEKTNMVFSSGAQWRVQCPLCTCRQLVGAPLLSRLYMS